MDEKKIVCKPLKINKRRMVRLPSIAVEVFVREFEKDPNWSSKMITDLAQRFDLPKMKVYKWNWDRRDK